MMRSRWRYVAWLTACGSLVFMAAAAGALGTARGAKAVGRAGHARPVTRIWNLTLSPAVHDLALAEIAFPKARRGVSVSGRTLRVAVSGPFGNDYMALATPIARAPDYPRALVAVVNRPSPLDDPVDVHLRVTARRALGVPVVWKLANPFSQPHPGLTPALCDLHLGGPTLSGYDLIALGSRGAPLDRFGVATTVAQAYDVACGLPYEGQFAQDVAPRQPVCAICEPGVACPALCWRPIAGGA